MTEAELIVASRMSKDVRAAAATLTDQEARYLVDSYYTMQNNRIRADGQIRSMSDEPHSVLEWLSGQNTTLENQIKGALERYVKSSIIGNWLLSITGIGPVISAGLLAHIDITKAPTVGHIWSFAGLDPQQVWEKGQKRPFNAELKTLCYKAGESFVKVQNNENDVYGKMFVKRKEYEWRRNLAGELAEQATDILAKKRIGKATTAYVFYAGLASPSRVKELLADKGVPQTYKGDAGIGDEVPMLPPAHIHARARRRTVKVFLSHFHEALYWDYYGEAPRVPFVIASPDHPMHEEYIPVPNRWW